MLTEHPGPPRPNPRSELLVLLRDGGPTSRAELAASLDVTRTRALAEVQELIAAGWIEEAGPARSRGGRRSTLLRLSPALCFAGVDIGATSIDVEICDGQLRPLAALSEAADIRNGPKAVLARVSDIIRKLLADSGSGPLTALGLGVPGPVSFRDGVPVSPPIMPGWDRYPVRQTLSRDLGCPVVVDNDVNIMAIGERHAGVASSVDDYLFLKIGTGIGCGIFIHGQVYRGTDGCAGDIGHMWVDDNAPICACGNAGCLEAWFGGAALARDATAAARSGTSSFLADRLIARGTVTARDVADGAAEGDAVCITLIREGGKRVGNVLAGLVSVLNPSMIVIGGGLSGLGHALLAEIRGVVYRRSLPLATGNMPIVLSELGARTGVVGAALLASDLAFGNLE
jgi:glucokinase-like ROK family protein